MWSWKVDYFWTFLWDEGFLFVRLLFDMIKGYGNSFGIKLLKKKKSDKKLFSSLRIIGKFYKQEFDLILLIIELKLK